MVYRNSFVLKESAVSEPLSQSLNSALIIVSCWSTMKLHIDMMHLVNMVAGTHSLTPIIESCHYVSYPDEVISRFGACREHRNYN